MKHRIFSIASLLLLAILSVPFVRAADPPAATRPATQPASFEKEITAFEEADRKQFPPAGANLFIGSSSIRMWKTLADDFAGRKVINRGFGGSQIPDSTRYADRIVIPYHPARIFFYAGDNDLNAGKSGRRVADDFVAFEQKVRAALPECDIYFISIKPSPSRAKLLAQSRECNQMIEQYIKTHPHLAYIDVMTPMLGADGQPRPELFLADKLHMTRPGYELWTKIIAPMVK